MSKERPILFSAPMVRAILSGAKTQTRRLIKSQPEHGAGLCHWSGTGWAPNAAPHNERGDMGCTCKPLLSPYGHPGDQLWVRETWRMNGWDENGDARIQYAADAESMWLTPKPQVETIDGWVDREMLRLSKAGALAHHDGLASITRTIWRPGIYLERWAARILLDVTDVRVERLHDITEADALAEGVRPSDAAIVFQAKAGDLGCEINEEMSNTARGAFACLWDGINAKRATWASNPWVWVVSFKQAQP